jgi:hypothetical protein
MGSAGRAHARDPSKDTLARARTALDAHVAALPFVEKNDLTAIV